MDFFLLISKCGQIGQDKMRKDVTHWETLPHETVSDDVIHDTLYQLEVDDIQVDDIVVVVNHCFTSVFGTKGLLSDIVIR